MVLGSTSNSFAGWVAGKYQDEGIDWYYYDDSTGVQVKNPWTADGYYVDEAGIWCLYITHENESFDDYVAKVANSLMDYYKHTEKWNFSCKADYVFSSEAEITNLNQMLYEALAVQIIDTYTYAGCTAVDNSYVISNAFVEFREY